MAPLASELATLRALTFRISSTPTSQLPKHVPAIATTLANCRTLLSSPQTSAAKSSSESSVAVHKYRTLLSTLLQDRTVQGRWSAIVLIKATIEIGGWETLQKCLPWVRGLLGILTKPDPQSSKKLCIITLTRIFVLTREYPTLVREITTPSLPAFIQSGLKMVSSTTPAALVQVILESFNELLPRHPTIFRSSLKQLHPLLLYLIAPTPSNKLTQEQSFDLTGGVVRAAQQLYVQTTSCAPKGASSEEWEKSLGSIINSAHRVADRVFRAVCEDWHSAAREASTNGHTFEDEVQDLDTNDMALPAWSGIFAGSERLVQLFRLVRQHLANPTASSVSINISAIVSLITRAIMLTVPGSGTKVYRNTQKFNTQVTKEERENLWLVLPAVHVAATEVLLVLVERSQSSTLPLNSTIIDQMVWLFAAEREYIQIRVACYWAVALLLQRSGAGLSKTAVDTIIPLMRACCEDLLPSESATKLTKEAYGQAKANGLASAQVSANADTFLDSSKGVADTTSGFLGLQEAASNLLSVFLASAPAQSLSDALRGRLDRTAILTQHKHAMLASVLNPPPSKKFGKPTASIIPLMARSFSASVEIESMLRPRMPILRCGGQNIEADGDVNVDEENETEETEEEEGGEEEEVVEQTAAENVNDYLIDHELNLISESAGQTKTAIGDPAVADGLVTSATNEIGAGKNKEKACSEKGEVYLKDSIKRANIDPSRQLPNKRAKVGDDAQLAPLDQTSTSAVLAPSSTGISTLVTSNFAATSTASAKPDPPEPVDPIDGESDSDEDDVVSLVMGQDTDESE